jgi:hypothetical protein
MITGIGSVGMAQGGSLPADAFLEIIKARPGCFLHDILGSVRFSEAPFSCNLPFLSNTGKK